MTDITIKKVPGAVEDLLLDANLPATVNQVRNGQVVEVTKINADTIPYKGYPGSPDFVSLTEKIGKGGQFVGAADLEVQPLIYTSKIVTEDTTIVNGTNALAIDTLEVDDGVTLTLEDEVVMKVV